MKHDFPGLIREKLPSGSVRYRVRPRGQKEKKIRIFCDPSDEDFHRQYQIARAGEEPKPLRKASEVAKAKSIGWLVNSYIEFLEKKVAAGTASSKTLKKKRNLLAKLLQNPNREMLIPQEKLIGMQDEMAATPAQADAFVEAVGVMYEWAKKRKHVFSNPAKGIDRVYVKGDGATPWKAADVRKYLAKHKIGSTPHVAISVLLWTGCRIEDLTVLGPSHECVIDGVNAIRWTPSKKNSTEVTVPLLPLLREATRAPKILGATYVTKRGGKAYSSGDAMSSMFKRWCHDAGLSHLSAHGVRKGLAELLAELGCSQYEIMAILGHSEAKTSEVYTRRVERWKLALGAMERVKVSHAWS